MPVDRPEAVPDARRPHRIAGGQPGLLAPGATTDPYRLRLYRLLRTEYPLGYDPALDAWLLSRYVDVALALTDPRFTGYPHDGAPRGRAPVPLGLCRGAQVCAPPAVPYRTVELKPSSGPRTSWPAGSSAGTGPTWSPTSAAGCPPGPRRPRPGSPTRA